MIDHKNLPTILVCPNCKGNFIEIDEKLACKQCGAVFGKNRYGFYDFLLETKEYEIDSTTDEYAQTQEMSTIRQYKEYIQPYLGKEPCNRVLDIGCGIGNGIPLMISEGYDAYGIDLPNVSKYWKKIDHSPERFFCCDAINLPFKDNFFDVVYSLGVIEHIGTITGHCTLSDNYWEIRQKYANEILRITKPNGRILIACPNKSHPFDLQHGPTDQMGPNCKIRQYIYNKTKINAHPIWGKYHLLSYAETKKLFCSNSNNKKDSFEPLPLNDYFDFKKYQNGFNKPIYEMMEFYVNNLPYFLRASVFNPYILVQIIK